MSLLSGKKNFHYSEEYIEQIWSYTIHLLCCFQVNALDSLGQTALHRVAQQGNTQACRLLMQYGVDTSIRSLQGYIAAELGTETIQKLLQGNL